LVFIETSTPYDGSVNEPDFAYVAALAGEPARAAMLSALFDGRAMPAGELARAAGVSAGTASAHLSKLVDGGLVRVRPQGRHRYYELARPEIARALEALGSIGQPAPIRSLSDSLRARRLRFARSCYNHLAGELAIALVESLLLQGALETDEEGFRLRERARSLLLHVGVDTSEIFRDSRAHIRSCIDWTERRAHVSGPLGAALLNALLASGALRRRDEPRTLAVTQAGCDLFREVFGIELSAAQIA
jgi:DNA-binding transcriptional ArsR family regulator